MTEGIGYLPKTRQAVNEHMWLKAQIPYEKPRMIEVRYEIDIRKLADDYVRRISEAFDDEMYRRLETELGLVKVVRCKDCKHSLLHGKECRHFSAYEPIAGGDEYEEMTFGVEPDGFCSWGERRAE